MHPRSGNCQWQEPGLYHCALSPCDRFQWRPGWLWWGTGQEEIAAGTRRCINSERTFRMNKDLATKVVDKMMADDKFSQWLGIKVILSEKGHCILKMKIRGEMVNGF